MAGRADYTIQTMLVADEITNNIGNVQLRGNSLEEQLTDADAEDGVLTFSADITNIEIYNTDDTNDGTFTVNGIVITVPKGQVYKSGIGGALGDTVTVTGATTYIISRYT